MRCRRWEEYNHVGPFLHPPSVKLNACVCYKLPETLITNNCSEEWQNIILQTELQHSRVVTSVDVVSLVYVASVEIQARSCVCRTPEQPGETILLVSRQVKLQTKRCSISTSGCAAYVGTWGHCN